MFQCGTPDVITLSCEALTVIIFLMVFIKEVDEVSSVRVHLPEYFREITTFSF